MINTRTRLFGIVMSKMVSQEIQPSISALSKEAGVSRSTIYKYYPDIIAAVKKISSGVKVENTSDSLIKMDLLRNRVRIQKVTIEVLTNICSNQLVEIFELNQNYERLKEDSSVRINYLESQLALASRSNLKIIK